MRYRCEKCGCYLDPGEQCDCNEQECIDQPRRQVKHKKTIYPREWENESYIKTKFQCSDMR